MTIDPSSGDVYALALDGSLCRIITSDRQSEICCTKLSYKHDEYKAQFPTISFVKSFIVVVGYLKTPKDDMGCPNRLFLLDTSCRVTGMVDIGLNGMIFSILL